MKKILCLILSMLMLFSLAACGEDEIQTDSSSEPLSSEEASTPAPPPIPVINGVSLDKFTVVYKNNNTVLQKFSDAAKEFTDYVKQTFGITLKCVGDNVAESEYEIIFGIVGSRDISKGKTKSYGHGGYTVAIQGKKMIFAATHANGCHAGAERFIEMIEESKDGVFNDMEFSGEKNIIKVACVGDSITHGGNSSDPGKTYPAFLQQMLGLDYFVLNAGVSGYSICKTDEYAYSKHSAYAQAKNLKPDVVLFALGINDANPTSNQPYKNWENPANQRETRFVQSTNELLDSFIAINPDVQIIMVLPTQLFKVGSDQWSAEAWNANIVKYSLPLLEKIAKDRKLQAVEFFDWSAEHKEIFTDGLHPKDDGYKTYAAHIYEEIKDTIKKPE